MSDVLSMAFSGFALLIAVGALWVSFRGYRVGKIQALPRLAIYRSWGSKGQRTVSFEIEWLPGRPDWVVAGASVRRNWRKRPFIARGQLEDAYEDEYGQKVTYYKPSGPWECRIIFDAPRRQGAVILHPEAPDCEVTLEITLTTLPSPTERRRIKIKRFWPR